MRVTRAKARENRDTVITAASGLFRERGFNGVGLNELMAAADLTHGGFYKQFESKDELIALAADQALSEGVDMWARVVPTSHENSFRALVEFYLSTEHRDRVGESCAFAALGADAARHSKTLRQTFQAGILKHLAALDAILSDAPDEATRDRSTALFASMLGALIMSRVVDDDALSQRILASATRDLLERAALGQNCL